MYLGVPFPLYGETQKHVPNGDNMTIMSILKKIVGKYTVRARGTPRYTRGLIQAQNRGVPLREGTPSPLKTVQNRNINMSKITAVDTDV